MSGISALLAALLFRRNIRAEVSLFISEDAIPHLADAWFDLLQSNPFVALSLLAVFDILIVFCGIDLPGIGCNVLAYEQKHCVRCPCQCVGWYRR